MFWYLRGSTRCRVERFEPDEEAAQPGIDRLFEQPGDSTAFTVPAPAKDGPCRACRQRSRWRNACRRQVVARKVEMAAGQTVDFRERVSDALGIERFAAFEETPPCSRSRTVRQPRETTIELGTRYSRR